MSDWKPNLFIPGFPKCGTTALCDYLAQHKDIYVIDNKEPHTLLIYYIHYEDLHEYVRTNHKFNFFVRNGNLKDMRRIFNNSPDFESYKNRYLMYINKRYRVDASQAYIDKIEIVKEFKPNAKIVLAIREQKRRLLSLYFFLYEEHRKDFDEWIDIISPYIDDFLFYNKILKTIRLFGKDNVRIVSNEALNKEPQRVMNSIFDFLDLEQIKVKPVFSNPSIKDFAHMSNLVAKLIITNTDNIFINLLKLSMFLIL